jgi:hypothetical protein
MRFFTADKIAVNCWSRFFEPSSGRLKDAFVAPLVVAKAEIAQVNLERADACPQHCDLPHIGATPPEVDFCHQPRAFVPRSGRTELPQPLAQTNACATRYHNHEIGVKSVGCKRYRNRSIQEQSELQGISMGATARQG